MNDVIQLLINSIGAILGVAVTFYFMMPLVTKIFNGYEKNIDAMAAAIQAHNIQAQQRHLGLLNKIDDVKNAVDNIKKK